jgi:hypothetical protein
MPHSSTQMWLVGCTARSDPCSVHDDLVAYGSGWTRAFRPPHRIGTLRVVYALEPCRADACMELETPF